VVIKKSVRRVEREVFVEPLDGVAVPDIEMGRCLDAGENGTSLEGGSGSGPGLPKRGKDRQLKPSKGGENMKEEEEPIWI
jgi:hypothetical protein